MEHTKENHPDRSASPPPRGTGRRIWDFCREMFVDHDFWLRALALKGGGSALLLAGFLIMGSVVSLPFVVATVAIVLSVGLIGLGIGGVLVGALRTWEQIKNIYHRVGFGKKSDELSVAPALPKTPWHQKPRVQKFLSRPTVKKITDSKMWQTSWSLAKRQEDVFLAGLAMKGSVFSVVGAAMILTTQIFLLPVIALGSLVTFTSFAAVGALIGGVYGIFLSAQSLLRSFRKKKADKMEADLNPPPAKDASADIQQSSSCSSVFNEQITPSNDNTAPQKQQLFFPRRGDI